MIIFKKPYFFIIIFTGLMLINVLIVEALCWNISEEIPYGDCNCVEFCVDNVPGYSVGLYCYGDPTCPPLVPGIINTGPKGRFWMCLGSCHGGGGGGSPTIVDCDDCSETYRFTREHWRAYGSCSGSRVSGSTTYEKDCSCQDNLTLACYPDANDGYPESNYDKECSPEITGLKLFDSMGNKELTIRETTQGEKFYMTLYQNFRIPNSQALLQYFATRATNCSLNCEYLSLDYIQEGTGNPTLPYSCNTKADGSVSFIPDEKYPYTISGGSFLVSPKYRGLVKYNLTCYGPEGGPNCGHTDPYEATSTINLVLYDFTYREVSPNEIINYLRNQLASISQIINQNLNTLREIVKI